MALDTPMMSESEIDILDKMIAELNPKYCLEWGSGGSTLYFPNQHRDIKLWLSIEHNGHYLDEIQNDCPPNVQTIWVLPGSSYADCVQRSNRLFDFILVDGLDRAKCIENGLRILSDKGIIVLHDAGRKDYEGIIKEFNGKIISEGEKPVRGGGYAHRGLAVFKNGS